MHAHNYGWVGLDRQGRKATAEGDDPLRLSQEDHQDQLGFVAVSRRDFSKQWESADIHNLNAGAAHTPRFLSGGFTVEKENVRLDALRVEDAGRQRHLCCCHHILHPALSAPNLRGLALALYIIGVKPTRVLHFENSLSAVIILDKKIWHIATLMLLPIDPRDGDAVSLHPFFDKWIGFEFRHHSTLKVAMKLFEAPRALLRVGKVAAYTNRHTR